MDEKRCSTCKKTKPITDFHKNVDRFRSQCKICSSESNRRSYHNAGEKARARCRQKSKHNYESGKTAIYIAKRKQARMIWVCEQLNIDGLRCSLCGYSAYPEALIFHHIDPSQKEISPRQLLSGKLDRLLEEAKKCILICSNCHMHIHFGAAMWRRTHGETPTILSENLAAHGGAKQQSV